MRCARPIAAVLAGATLALIPALAAVASTTDTVLPSRIGVDWHTADTRAGASVKLDALYGGALGTGAVVLDTRDSESQKAQLFTDAWDGTPLADITALSYATYQAVAPTGSVTVPALNIRLDRDADGDVDAYLVFEPYQDQGNAAIVPQRWQTWDALRDGQATWWSGQITECPQHLPCTWDRLVTLFPNATIREDPTSLRSGSTPADAVLDGSIGVNQGSGNPGVVGAADALRIATADRDVTYDFEPAVTLAGKHECKDGGWSTSNDPVFRSQGDCVSHFTAGSRAQAAL